MKYVNRLYLVVAMFCLSIMALAQATPPTPEAGPTDIDLGTWANAILGGYVDTLKAVMPYAVALLAIMVGPRLLKKLIKSFSH